MKNDIDKKPQNGGYQSKVNINLIKMFKDSPDFIFIHDLNGNIIEINKNMQKILGLRKQETKLENLSNNIICLDDDKTLKLFLENLGGLRMIELKRYLEQDWAYH